MNLAETAKLLAKAQILDNRTVDRVTVEAWHEALQHVDARDAFAALTLHRQRSTDWLQPAHIVALSKETKRDREHDENRARALRALPPAPPKPMPPSFRAFLNTLGKGPYASPAARKTHGGSDGHGSDPGASERPSRAPRAATRETA